MLFRALKLKGSESSIIEFSSNSACLSFFCWYQENSALSYECICLWLLQVIGQIIPKCAPKTNQETSHQLEIQQSWLLISIDLYLTNF